MMRIGLYGGSFNPPHLGHQRAALYFREQLALDEVRILPAKQAPLRAAPEGASGEDRLALCRLTFSFPVCGIELRRPGISYTIDTLRQLQAETPGAQWFLLIGSDQLEKFTLWHSWQEILQLCTVCALPRSGDPLQTDVPIRLLHGFTPLDVSSTQIRAALARGDDTSAWLTPQALDYIKNKKLYGTG